MCRVIYSGGPKDRTWEELPVPVPSREFPIYAEAEGELVCADEQVVVLLGRYRRADGSTHSTYTYNWYPA